MTSYKDKGNRSPVLHGGHKTSLPLPLQLTVTTKIIKYEFEKTYQFKYRLTENHNIFTNISEMINELQGSN